MNRRNILITALVAVALVAAVALAALAMSGSGPEPRSFTAADDGSSVDLAVGESFSIVLEGNPTTGYAWEVESGDPSVLTAAEPEYTAQSDLIGSGGTYTFTFTAAEAGETQVRLVYQRPWEHVEPLEVFTLTVSAH